MVTQKCLLCMFLLILRSQIALSGYETYYVQPTEPLSSISCPKNDSCPAGQQCHKMDYYARNSSVFFSPNKSGITLYFMCGVHNCTKNLLVHNLSSLSMIGASSANVIINMPMRSVSRHAQIENFYAFFNVHNMKLENLTINYISIAFGGKGCLLTVKNSVMAALMTSFSSGLNIKSASLSLVNCTLQKNIFLWLNKQGSLALRDCLVEQYSSTTIWAMNTTIVLSGTVKFIDNKPYYGSSLSGGVLNLSKSILLIQSGANVFFINNTASAYGGSIFVEGCTIKCFGNLWFISNKAGREGGAIYMSRSSMFFLTNAVTRFLTNWSPRAGAVSMVYSTVYVSQAKVIFINNNAIECGAVYLHSSNLNVTDHSLVSLINNNAKTLAGAIFLISARLCTSNNAQVLLVNNTALQGGGIYLYSSVIKISSGLILLKNNTVLDVGGGIFAVVFPNAPCFYYPGVGYTGYINGTIKFTGNIAKNGIGQHIYGSSSSLDSRCSYEYFSNHPTKPFCRLYHRIFKFEPGPNTIPSVVSSDPKRVCLCDSNGLAQCAQLSKIFVRDIQVYPGETFRLSATVVGYDFGTTKGTVHASFLPSNATAYASLLPFQYDQWTARAECTEFNYTIFSFAKHEVMSLHSQKIPINFYGNIATVNQSIENWRKHYCIDEGLLTTPVYINVSILPCPPGFYQENVIGQSSGCICDHLLTDHSFKCTFINKTGYHIWNNSMWVSATNDGVLYYNPYCPLDYCKSGPKIVNLGEQPSAQCAFNHAGALCGGCQANYSLAIGSSRCIHCSNNNNVALLIFFIAAGIILVLFIPVLNLTVTQGLINGLVFYANILWTYKSIWFPRHQNILISVFYVFIAWLNLDFGIESCFVRDLDALWKTWLQFLFPLYIWVLAGSIIFISRYSSHITKFIGSRAVPLLATLFLLSYLKLLRTIIEALAFAVLISYPEGHDRAVWYLDGNYMYCKPPHTYLFIAALIALILLWCPYTFILLSIQWLRRVSHLKCLRWTTKFTPFYDACFAPLKDKHHYWFGILLLIRGVLLLVYSLTFTIIPDINLLILIVVLMLLLVYTLVFRVYKQKSVTILECLLLGNLIVLSGSTKLFNDRSIIVAATSIGLAFAQFCGIFVWSLIKPCVEKRRQDYVNLEDASSESSDLSYKHILRIHSCW